MNLRTSLNFQGKALLGMLRIVHAWSSDVRNSCMHVNLLDIR
jgi:hypothetical protein